MGATRQVLAKYDFSKIEAAIDDLVLMNGEESKYVGSGASWPLPMILNADFRAFASLSLREE